MSAVVVFLEDFRLRAAWYILNSAGTLYLMSEAVMSRRLRACAEGNIMLSDICLAALNFNFMDTIMVEYRSTLIFKPDCIDMSKSYRDMIMLCAEKVAFCMF